MVNCVSREGSGAAAKVVKKPSSGLAKNKHVKDCQRYRDKMARKFEELASTIPGVASDGSVNHRAKVIDHTMYVLNQLLEETKDLQLQLAMTDRKRMNKWIEKVVSSAQDLEAATMPLLDLIVNKRGWKYAEFWSVVRLQGSAVATMELNTHKVERNLSSGELQLFNELQRKHAEDKLQPETGLLKRTVENMRGQSVFLGPSSPSSGKSEASVASSLSLGMCFAVPIIVQGHVRGVAAFYETICSEGEAMEALHIAEEVANVIGNVFGSRPRLWSRKKGIETSTTLSNLSSGSEPACYPGKKSETRASIPFLLNAGA
eukprot:CAMPEP_0184752180 /NCGR_PEP_ID=MMETSP0315-20130426/43443_1 /TAXON_ID=101924 /ORGANISM="Rhodosorus marinus, Strain UTEX LB 2760" /LENGTH=316 /DNA_ID=CAMNT_0027231497 /DNA_START=170 /DNA_END=1120 /DNA_ORIENTATION=+